jgi:arylsulfatase A-like enzyme
LPKETVGKVYKNQGSHLDIMPTILDLLGVKTSILMFGQSLFATGSGDLRTCVGQMSVFMGPETCQVMLAQEKNMSAKIIRYNLFGILPK